MHVRSGIKTHDLFIFPSSVEQQTLVRSSSCEMNLMKRRASTKTAKLTERTEEELRGFLALKHDSFWLLRAEEKNYRKFDIYAETVLADCPDLELSITPNEFVSSIKKNLEVQFLVEPKRTKSPQKAQKAKKTCADEDHVIW